MNSKKKPAASKRTNLPRTSELTNRFCKDWKRLSHSGKYDLKKLKAAMMLLIGNDAPLPSGYENHELTGEWAGHYECHIGGDFLLIYYIEDNCVVFVRAGTHSELF